MEGIGKLFSLEHIIENIERLESLTALLIKSL